MNKVFRYLLPDILRNKIVFLYTIALLLISFSIFNISETPEKAIISLLNIQLAVLPLMCSVFATIYFYNSAEFIEVLATQPLKRRTIFLSMLAGLSLALSLAFIFGCGIPLLLFTADATSFLFLLTGVILTITFTAFALLASVFAKDKAVGIGISLLTWFCFTILFDGLVLFLMFRLSDYPIEKAVVGLSFLNPVDLTRILILLQVDVAAVMGYTGALFKDFFGTAAGMTLSATALLTWFLFPAWLALRKFKRKDL